MLCLGCPKRKKGLTRIVVGLLIKLEHIRLDMNISFYLDEELREKVKEEAEKLDRSRSATIRIILRKYFGIENGK